MAFLTGKNGYTRPVDFVSVPDPTRKTSTRTRPIPAGTGRVRVYPRVRVDPHTSMNLIPGEIIVASATISHILKLKCIQFDFGWSFAHDPAGGAYSFSQTR